MKFHPFAEVFPLLPKAELDELVADIETYGQREPIWIYQGKVLDGRNRFLACQQVKVQIRKREFRGTDAEALALVVSANIRRRQLTASQLAMAAARIATLSVGGNQHSEGVSIETGSKLVGASKASAKRARKVVDKGSKQLQQAVDSGQIPVSRAASVVDLPKPEQLAAAKAKPAKQEIPPPEDWEPDIDEADRIAAIEREQAASLDKILAADDKLASAHAEIERQAAEIAMLKLSRDGYMNKCGEQVRIIKRLQARLDKLEKRAA